MPVTETLVCGDIKLGFAVSKGQLEVDVICVRGLKHPAALQPPGQSVCVCVFVCVCLCVFVCVCV